MKLVSATTGTVFPQLQPLGVVPFVLGGGIRPLFAFGAGEVDYNPGFGLSCHTVLLYNLGKATSADGSAPLPNGEAQARLHGHRVD